MYLRQLNRLNKQNKGRKKVAITADSWLGLESNDNQARLFDADARRGPPSLTFLIYAPVQDIEFPGNEGKKKLLIHGLGSSRTSSSVVHNQTWLFDADAHRGPPSLSLQVLSSSWWKSGQFICAKKKEISDNDLGSSRTSEVCIYDTRDWYIARRCGPFCSKP
jgi:hypothetical protein